VQLFFTAAILGSIFRIEFVSGKNNSQALEMERYFAFVIYLKLHT
jgi:hypothetical protein